MAEGLRRVRATSASGGCLSVSPCWTGTRGSEKRLPGQGQGSPSRWGQQVSLPAFLGQVRLKMRWSRRCSQAGC